jgi:hypothetical protein
MNHQAYTLPYIVDVAGPIPGMRVYMGQVDTSSDQVIVSVDQSLALTLGAAVSLSDSSLNTTVDNGYSVLSTNELGLTLQWVSYLECAPILCVDDKLPSHRGLIRITPT